MKRGEKIKLTSDVSLKESGTEKEIYVDYVKLPDTVATGGTIFVDDGLISLKALEKVRKKFKINSYVILFFPN